MALGICMECQRLTAIRPGSQKWGSRECDWFPVDHPEPLHKTCGQIVVDISNAPVEEPFLYCKHCDVTVAYSDVKFRGSCPGVKRAIK